MLIKVSKRDANAYVEEFNCRVVTLAGALVLGVMATASTGQERCLGQGIYILSR